MSEPAKLFQAGLIRTGRISDIYLKILKKYPQVDIVVCGGLHLGRKPCEGDRPRRTARAK